MRGIDLLRGGPFGPSAKNGKNSRSVHHGGRLNTELTVLTNEQMNLREQFLVRHPWAATWWRPAPGGAKILLWFVLIHVTALVGLIMVPLPPWPIALAALVLTWLGGIGTTVCYHRSLAHRSLKLNPVIRNILTFFAVLNGSGTPTAWTANHRLHHATSDTIEDVSSPRIGGFWWAHLRWIWQAGEASVQRYSPDLDRPEYRIWYHLQVPIMFLSYLGGLVFGLAGFFWLGAIRLVFSLHAQCFVNSICHMGGPATEPGLDSSRNVPWLAVWHLFQGENWHGNHHAQPWSARLGLKPMQVDAGWWVIVVLEKLRLAMDVRRPRPGVMTAQMPVPVESPRPLILKPD